MLSRSDVAALKKTRERVQEIERRISADRIKRNFDLGRLAEACRAVDDAILQVLVLARVHNLGVSEDDLRLTSQKDAA